MLVAALALGFNAPTARPAVTTSRVAAPAISMAVSTPPATEPKVRGVPMTGDVLKASLKMRCDTSGAAYAIYWANIGGDLKVVGEYKAANYQKELKERGVTVSFGEASKPFVLDAFGTGPIATVLKTGEPYFVEDAVTCNTLQRRCVASSLTSRRKQKIPSAPPLPLHTIHPSRSPTMRSSTSMLSRHVAASWRASTASSR